MDAQLKKGIIDICVLSSLMDGPSYGYKIIKDISDKIEISESTLYPILKRLEQNKYVLVKTEEYQGRLRKYYHITEEGIKKIKEFLIEFEEVIKTIEYIKEKCHE